MIALNASGARCVTTSIRSLIPLICRVSTAADGWVAAELVTAGGRVLAVTAVAATLADAQRASADYAAGVTFAGRQFRRDIGWRELQRARA